MSEKVVGGDTVTVVRDWVEDKLGDTSAQNDAVVAAINSLSDKPLNGAGLAVLRGWINAKIASIPTGPDLDEATADATAVASDISDGKTAYVKGVKVIGTLPDVVGVNLYQSGSILSGIGDIPNGSGGSDFVNRTTIAGTMTNDRILREGARVSIVTASSLFGDADPSDVLAGKTFTAKDGKETGTIATKSASDLTASGPTVTVPAGYFASAASKSVDTAIQATPVISVDANGLITANATQGAGYVSAGTKTATQQLPVKTSADMSVDGATVTASAGYFASQASKSVDTATQAIPAISVDANGLITASATQTAGYVIAGTKSATQQLSTKSSTDLTANGATVTAPAGYYPSAASKAVTTATQATPSATINTSTGLVTASATQTAGYVTAGTKSGTLQLTTKAAATITPGASNKTAVSAGVYTLGAIVVSGDSNLIAANIKSGVNIFGVDGTLIKGGVDLTWSASTISSSVFSADTKWTSITYGEDGYFVAVANGINRCASCIRGGSWAAPNLPATANWTSVAYGMGMFVAVGYGTAASTTRGSTSWYSATLPSTADWSSVAHGAGRFVAVASGSNNSVYNYSNTDMTWKAASLPSSANWSSIAYGAGYFVAIASGSNKAAYSSNALSFSWSIATLPSTADWSSVAHGAGRFVAVASGSNKAAYGLGPGGWTAATLPATANWTSVAYGMGMFVAVASGSNKAAYSVDGKIWSALTLPSTANWSSIAYGNGVFIAVADGSKAIVISSVL